MTDSNSNPQEYQAYKIPHHYASKHTSKPPRRHTLEQPILLELDKMLGFSSRETLPQLRKLRDLLSALSHFLTCQ